MSASPIASLYLHAQHSICAWCCLRDLAFLSRVNRSWRAATSSAPSIGAHVWLTEALWIVAQTGLARHVTELHNSIGRSCVLLNDERSALVALKMPQLRRMVCSLMVPFARAPTFPVNLTSLHVNLWNPRHHYGYAPAPEFNVLLDALPALASLRSLVLSIPDADLVEMSFEPLQRCHSLRDLSLSCHRVTDAHVDQLRGLKQLECFACANPGELLPRLLRPPHELQWQCIDTTLITRVVVLTPASCEALASMRSLTRLDAEHKSGSLAFLGDQRNLTSLRFTHDRDIPVDQILDGLCRCHALTELSLHHCLTLTGPQLSAVLAALPHLTRLELRHVPWLESLRCLEQPHLAERLRTLHLGVGTFMHWCQLQPILSLRHLTHLNLSGWFIRGQMDRDFLRALMPPSVALPDLVVFEPTPSKLVKLPAPPVSVWSQESDRG